MEIKILTDFTEYPGLRHCSISEKSGEEFYHTVLNLKFFENLSKPEKLVVNLDNTGGYASSFLDEAFGNLVFDFSLAKVKNKIEIVSIQEPHWKDMIFDKTFIEWGVKKAQKQNPKVTKLHNPWYRIDDKEIKLDVWEKPTATP